MAMFKALCCGTDTAEAPRTGKSLSVDEATPRVNTLPVYLRGDWGRKMSAEETVTSKTEVPIITLVPPDGRETLIFQEGKMSIQDSQANAAALGFLSC